MHLCKAHTSKELCILIVNTLIMVTLNPFGTNGINDQKLRFRMRILTEEIHDERWGPLP